MRTYNPSSPIAEEFIHHDEILDTVEYVKENKHNLLLMKEILKEAKQMNGLSHRQAALLLECEDEEILEEIFALAKAIKERIYGNRIVMFAPLYLSNYCVNGCTYCPYHQKKQNDPTQKTLSGRDRKRGHRPAGYGT